MLLWGGFEDILDHPLELGQHAFHLQGQDHQLKIDTNGTVTTELDGDETERFILGGDRSEVTPAGQVWRQSNGLGLGEDAIGIHIPDVMDPNWTPAMLGEAKRSLLALAVFLERSGAFTKLGTPFHLDLILPPPRDPRPP